ncbi:glycosyltransferase family 2 protein [Providencia rettgeri]|uniref:glycosyltransferase family 2 protein n=1 Tax=Morganellaceae TaxID=1903414 RepID=UPI0034E3B809
MNINPLQAPEDEASIIKHWKYTDKVYISCVCITFNQEGYIRDAINGMLAQVTDYRFEVIIHDDGSTDNTRDILLEYSNKYPNIIKLVLQEENQYKKGKKITPLATAHANGEYVALCEGDDYWIDKNKIQNQSNHLKNNASINICFTSAKSISNSSLVKFISHHSSEKEIYTVAQVLEGGGAFMPTASIMLKTKLMHNLPEWYYTAPVGDYFLQIYLSTPNGAIYLPDLTCVYRIHSSGSWSSQRKCLSIQEIKSEGALYIETLQQLKNIGISQELIDRAISKQYIHLASLAIKNNFFQDARSLIDISWKYSKNITKKQTILYYTKVFYPCIKLWISVKKALKN